MEPSSQASQLEEGDHDFAQPCLSWNTHAHKIGANIFSVKGDRKWNEAIHVTSFLSVVGTSC